MRFRSIWIGLARFALPGLAGVSTLTFGTVAFAQATVPAADQGASTGGAAAPAQGATQGGTTTSTTTTQ